MKRSSDCRTAARRAPVVKPKSVEKSGGKVSYYTVEVTKPNQLPAPYFAECSDIIEALGMNFNEGEAFKALWRKAAARTLGLTKAGNTDLYDAQKVEHYGRRERILLED